jgi:hypothetical protein
MGVTEGAGPRRWPLLNLGRARGPIGSTSPGLSDKKISPGQQQCSARGLTPGFVSDGGRGVRLLMGITVHNQ